jgi:hypothetical protein
VPNMIQAQIMQNHCIPISIAQLARNMPRHILIHFGKILQITSTYDLITLSTISGQWHLLTETKKLVVPSARTKKSGKSFNHVSSPYITSLPPSFAFNCASQVSWVARLDEVSDSAKLRMTSRKEGIEPDVMALTRGMVMVGDVACAVNGRAVPSRIRLFGC